MPIKSVHARGLTKAFGTTVAVRAADLAIQAGTLTVIRGANGSGKSTLLRMLGLLMRPTRGTITINDQPALPGSRWRSHIGIVMHEGWLYPELSGRQNLELNAALHGVSLSDVMQAAQRLDCQTFIDQPVGTCSRGQRQRLALARALLSTPGLLLLDEPTAGLDSQATQLLTQVITEQRQRGTAIVVVSHNEQWTSAIADRTVTIVQGTLESP